MLEVLLRQRWDRLVSVVDEHRLEVVQVGQVDPICPSTHPCGVRAGGVPSPES